MWSLVPVFFQKCIASQLSHNTTTAGLQYTGAAPTAESRGSQLLAPKLIGISLSERDESEGCWRYNDRAPRTKCRRLEDRSFVVAYPQTYLLSSHYNDRVTWEMSNSRLLRTPAKSPHVKAYEVFLKDLDMADHTGLVVRHFHRWVWHPAS